MYRKYLLAAALGAVFAAPAFAATTMPIATKHTYYVSQDTKTLKCYVVTKIGKRGSKIGATGYKTKTAATKAMAAAPECNKM